MSILSPIRPAAARILEGLVAENPTNPFLHDFVRDPGWKPIQDQPRFRRLLTEHGLGS